MLLVKQVLEYPAELVGYARVSTGDQTLDLQSDALDKAGCDRVFTDILPGSKSLRPGHDELLTFVWDGDTLMVWRLDRLGRSLRHLIETVTTLRARGVGFRSFTEAIDTTTTDGKLIFHISGALAEFEREVIRERTNAGLAAARARGRTGDRPKAISDPKPSSWPGAYTPTRAITSGRSARRSGLAGRPCTGSSRFRRRFKRWKAPVLTPDEAHVPAFHLGISVSCDLMS